MNEEIIGPDEKGKACACPKENVLRAEIHGTSFVCDENKYLL